MVLETIFWGIRGSKMVHGANLWPSEVPETMTRAIETKNKGPKSLGKNFYRQCLIILFFAFLRHKMLICIKSLSTIFCCYFFSCLVGSLKYFKTNFRNRFFLKSFSGEFKGGGCKTNSHKMIALYSFAVLCRCPWHRFSHLIIPCECWDWEHHFSLFENWFSIIFEKV